MQKLLVKHFNKRTFLTNITYFYGDSFCSAQDFVSAHFDFIFKKCYSRNRNNPNRKHHKCLPLEKPDEVLQHFTVTLQDLRLQASTSTPSNDVFATFELYFPDLPVWFIVSAGKLCACLSLLVF